MSCNWEPADKVAIGDEVVLIGKQENTEITVDEIAQRVGTIPYEILTQIGPRVKRTFRPVTQNNENYGEFYKEVDIYKSHP